MFKFFKTAFFAFFAAVFFLMPAFADSNDTKNNIDFNKINKKLEQIDNALKNENLTEDNINE